MEWGELLDRVDVIAKGNIKEDGGLIRDQGGNSLESLSKNVRDVAHVTYIPSRSGDGADRSILSLYKKDRPKLRKVAAQKVTLLQARKASG
ncbi:MAG: hypothetical protein JXQ99_16315 [Hyphomicrobiaceae bacterium]